jgi:hypothetical protein
LNRHTLLRTVLLWTGGAVIVTVALTFAFTWISYRKATLGTAPGVMLHPRRIETPFTLGTEIKPSEFAATLRLPIYPGALAEESTLSRWFPTPRPQSGKGKGVALLQLQAEGPLARAEVWYKDQLGTDFVRTDGNLAAIVEGSADWLRRVSRSPSANAVLFLRNQAGAQDGVLLEPNHGNDRVRITLFRYSGPRP